MGLEWTWVVSILHVLLVPSCLTHDNSNTEYFSIRILFLSILLDQLKERHYKKVVHEPLYMEMCPTERLDKSNLLRLFGLGIDLQQIFLQMAQINF